MNNSNTANEQTHAISDKVQAARDELDATWEMLRANPENLKFGLKSVAARNIAYYRLNPPSEEFHDFAEFEASVGVCGDCNYDFPSRPDEGADVVLLGINGLQGSRLVNVLLNPDEARRLTKLLKKAAKSVGTQSV